MEDFIQNNISRYLMIRNLLLKIPYFCIFPQQHACIILSKNLEAGTPRLFYPETFAKRPLLPNSGVRLKF